MLYLFKEYPTMIDLNHALAKCTVCQYGTQSKKVGGIGPSQSKLVVVGQNPGPKEVNTGKPFSGVSGDLLKRMMRRVGIDPDKVYLTNVVKCKAEGEDKIATPSVSICGKHWLDHEIDLVSPVIIVALGAVSSSYLVDKASAIGVMTQSKYGIPCITTYHTAYIQRLFNASKESQYSKNKYDEIKAESDSHWKEVARYLREVK
jgi:uracil-DNA glycosylase family 4